MNQADPESTPEEEVVVEAEVVEDPAPEAPEGDSGAGVEPAAGDELSRVKAERDEYLDLAQRTRADFDNYRKRTAADLEAATVRGRLEVANGVIAALDNLERVLKAEGLDPVTCLEGSFPDGASVSLQGVIVAWRDLNQALTGVGVEGYDPRGDAFDPNLHEALQAIEADGVESGTVVEVMERGYRAGDQVVRAARVVVSQ
jgi:molecular chaperone GrpE